MVESFALGPAVVDVIDELRGWMIGKDGINSCDAFTRFVLLYDLVSEKCALDVVSVSGPFSRKIVYQAFVCCCRDRLGAPGCDIAIHGQEIWGVFEL